MGRDGYVNGSSELVYLPIKDITSLSFTPQPSTIENHEQGSIVPEENVEAVKQGCLFSIDDSSEQEELNNLLTKLALNGTGSKSKFWLKISKQKNGNYIEQVKFPVVLSVTLSYPYGDSDVGSFTVSCTRKEE